KDILRINANLYRLGPVALDRFRKIPIQRPPPARVQCVGAQVASLAGTGVFAQRYSESATAQKDRSGRSLRNDLGQSPQRTVVAQAVCGGDAEALRILVCGIVVGEELPVLTVPLQVPLGIRPGADNVRASVRVQH